jgi:uncharacterized repeat protein (TIGR02543 family)
VLKLYYDREIYNIDFIDHDDSVIKSETVRYMGSATAPTQPEREGYTFTGWDRDFENITGDLSVKAVYSINQYTITFDSAGGSAVAEITDDYGATITAPSAPTRDGYTFDGWDPELPETMPAGDLQLTAQWTANEYSITYNLDNGTNHEDNPTNYTIETETITLKAATKTGYTFDGWYDAAMEGNKVETIAKGTTGEKTLYARWSANGYTVTFDACGGTPTPESMQVTYDGTYGEMPVVTQTGYTFEGWFTEETGGNRIESSTTVKITGNITLYAHWEPTPARSVELLIEELPVVAVLTLKDLDAVEAAEAAYESLSTDEQGQVSPVNVNSLNSAVAKITQLVFEDLDTRFEDARGELLYENTGIQGIEYENHKATFFIDNPDSAVHHFLQSGVDRLFDAMFRDVVEVRLGVDETWYEIEEGPMGGIGAAARLVSAMLDIPFTPPLGDVSKLATTKLSELQGKGRQ